ncbi:hypothetical protein G6011_11580 [Alternaria panax]|uniref:Uncharacterized protein n=1 Tax=Alternaria panax TaxID=48097 RepID=A0AAD4NQ57_9PLEO|nr:hypothetical protein G6011_11580 [Alternaria panax]
MSKQQPAITAYFKRSLSYNRRDVASQVFHAGAAPESSKDLDDSSPQPDHEIQSRTPSNVTSDAARAQTPENDVQRSLSAVSSELISPMMSPGLRALGASLDEEARNTSPTTAYDCFNLQPHLKGHFYSANRLFSRGVWIGYLAPDRQNQSFRGLPSFHSLKINFSRCNPPFPPAVQGYPRENRNAVCRGCAREESAFIALSEMQFGKNVKVVIMPLDGDDDSGVFAIMIPQKSDRSLHGLQSFRPYEISGGGMGDTFVNNYRMLTLRNPDSNAGTLETVLTALTPKERADTALKLKQLPERSKRLSSTLKLSRLADEDATPLAPHAMANMDDNGENDSDAQIDTSSMRKRRKMSDSTAKRSGTAERSPKNRSVHLVQPPPPRQTPQRTQTPADDVKHHAPIVSELSRPTPQTTTATDSSKIISLDLTDEQAERIYFIWPVIDDDIEYEFVYTLGECESFRGLLDLLEEDAEAIPSAASMMSKTIVWRATYRIGDSAKKANVLRKGTEAAFDRLQTTLAQASIWQDNPNAKINIELTSLSKPDPV